DGEWLLFASEIKALLASGMVDARPDLRGIDQVFNFFSVPGPATCFAGIEYLQPGHFIRIPTEAAGPATQIAPRPFWRIDFPDRGHEDYEATETQLIDGFERVLMD